MALFCSTLPTLSHALLREGQHISADPCTGIIADLLRSHQRLPEWQSRSLTKGTGWFHSTNTPCSAVQGEYYACALSNIYTFGPTFRAENSHTSRHLAEFWMIEPEIAFCDLQDTMRCAEDYVRFCCQSILQTCR